MSQSITQSPHLNFQHPSQMKQVHDLLERVLKYGKIQINKRTNSECRVLTGEQLKFNLADGFPALTTRKLFLKSTIAEQVGFFRGLTSAKDFRELGCGFWDTNANETKAWLENPIRKGTDDVGNIYGALWNNWETFKFIKNDENSSKANVIINYLQERGWEYVSDNYIDHPSIGDPGIYSIMMKQINQLEEAVRKIMTDPSDRRIIITGWDPGQYDFQSLPACHMDYRFIPFEDDKTMDLVMTMRSADLYLGIPANIINTAVFLHTVCRLTGYTPGTMTIQITNAHLYDNSYKNAEILLTREHQDQPALELSENIKQLKSVDEIKGCFSRIKTEDYIIHGYNPLPALERVAMKA